MSTIEELKDSRKKKVETILISQPEPSSANNPYREIASKHNVKFDFHSFIQIDPVEAKEFRKYKIDLTEYDSVVLTSKQAAEHYFRICDEMRHKVTAETKFYCLNEATALYLQKYIQYRRRRISFGNGKPEDLCALLKKNSKNKFLFVSSNLQTSPILTYMEEEKFNYKDAILFRTVAADLSHFSDITYDMVVFFTPEGVRSLYKNFPKFKQNDTRIGAFGQKTISEIQEHKLILDVVAPANGVNSIFQAMENYLKEANTK